MWQKYAYVSNSETKDFSKFKAVLAQSTVPSFSCLRMGGTESGVMTVYFSVETFLKNLYIPKK